MCTGAFSGRRDTHFAIGSILPGVADTLTSLRVLDLALVGSNAGTSVSRRHAGSDGIWAGNWTSEFLTHY